MMMNSPFFCSQCGRDLVTPSKEDNEKVCPDCLPKSELQHKEKHVYKGLLGESTWWQKRK
ncbi:hypothetical protein [Alkalihalobacterium chitinilyticum]|uniref:Uncharacterized protein n=1 Tax=Alkalihalobacterium chitinilyticum TaxID=2980103 RepID=A0ABT5VJ34_9BACI|nr:hypothetical protein [Alkalihalobacterium chitinilyticum]MDE5415458.1 hypothetical protein [Alkalihalobacterium chitinilyticum]